MRETLPGTASPICTAGCRSCLSAPCTPTSRRESHVPKVWGEGRGGGGEGATTLAMYIRMYAHVAL